MIFISACGGSGDQNEGRRSAGSSGNAPCSVPSYILSDTTPIGWASQNGGTTGGGTTPAMIRPAPRADRYGGSGELTF